MMAQRGAVDNAPLCARWEDDLFVGYSPRNTHISPNVPKEGKDLKPCEEDATNNLHGRIKGER